jgi:hypothetical protein
VAGRRSCRTLVLDFLETHAPHHQLECMMYTSRATGRRSCGTYGPLSFSPRSLLARYFSAPKSIPCAAFDSIFTHLQGRHKKSMRKESCDVVRSENHFFPWGAKSPCGV